MRPDALEQYDAASWPKRLRRDRPVKLFLREMREYLLLVAKGDAPAWFLQGIRGFTATDAGAGLIVEALRGRNGELAPSVLELLQDGRFNDAMQRDLDRFLEALFNSSIALSGIATYNVVYACDSARGERFVLVDGFGDRSLLQLKSIIPELNQRAKRRQLQWFAGEVTRLRRNPSDPRRAKKRERRKEWNLTVKH
jgi:hypothetical protein